MIKYAAFIVLIILNVVSLYELVRERENEKNKQVLNNDSANNVNVEKELISIDTILAKSWQNNNELDNHNNPIILFFFSKKNCQTCTSTIFDNLSRINKKTLGIFYISTDIKNKNEQIPYLAKFQHLDRFYSLEKISFSKDLRKSLPLLLFVDRNKNILFSKSIIPMENKFDDKLFWERLKFIENSIE